MVELVKCKLLTGARTIRENVLNMFTKRYKVKGLDTKVRNHAIYRVKQGLVKRIRANIEIRISRNPFRVVLVLKCIVILTSVRVISTLILQTEVSAESGLCKILAPIVVRHRERFELMFVVRYKHGKATSYVIFGAQHVDEVSTEAISGMDARYVKM